MMDSLNEYFDKIKRTKKYLTFNLIFILISFVIVFFSNQFSSYADYFWMDYIFAQYSHNQNLIKNIFEVLPNPSNIHGIPIWMLEPTLNPLAKFAYNLSGKMDYVIYLSLLRTLEIITILIFVYCFSKKIELIDFSIIIFLYVALLVNFNRYDHEPYVNFPIIVFCLFHALSILFKKNYLFFIFVFIGNLWAYLINPVYFFIVCFLPLLFFYSYFLYQKQFKRFFLAILANSPFAILFLLISIGNSRISLSELFTGGIPIYNFAIFQSENFLLITIFFLILSILNLKKNHFYSWFFLIYTVFCIVAGIIFYINPQWWKIPSPYQIEYSLQYIIIFIFYKILKTSNKNLLFFLVAIVLINLFLYRSFFFTKKYINLNNVANEELFYDQKKELPKKYFWSNIENNFFIEKNLNNKRVILFLPNKGSDFHKNYASRDLNNIKEMEDLSIRFNKNLGGSLIYTYFWEKKIVVDQGYSFNLDISSVLSNYFNPSTKEYFDEKYKKNYKIKLTNDRTLSYLQVPKLIPNSSLLNFYQIDYILTDITLHKYDLNNYKIDKTYKFKEFSLYLYKKKNFKNSTEIRNVNIISNYNEYSKNIPNFINQIYILKKDITKIRDLKNFCSVQIIHKNDQILFEIKKLNSKECLAVFPIPFSYNNFFIKFYEKNDYKNKCDTFRVQYYFHGCIISESSQYILKKNNLMFYPFSSLQDYLDLKLIKSQRKDE